MIIALRQHVTQCESGKVEVCQAFSSDMVKKNYIPIINVIWKFVKRNGILIKIADKLRYLTVYLSKYYIYIYKSIKNNNIIQISIQLKEETDFIEPQLL